MTRIAMQAASVGALQLWLGAAVIIGAIASAVKPSPAVKRLLKAFGLAVLLGGAIHVVRMPAFYMNCDPTVWGMPSDWTWVCTWWI